MSVLYIVATPIGNLGDITLRAAEILREVNIIACEDTRHSSKLLSHLGISKKLISCHGYNEDKRASLITELLKENDIAYITDSGTPGISDPGFKLVKKVREAGYQIVPIPGPTAIGAFLSACGLPTSPFYFAGFLSPKSGRRKNQIAATKELEALLIFYESPFRIHKLIADLYEVLGDKEIAIGREMTKIHEQIMHSTLKDFSENPDKIIPKGEFVIGVNNR